MMQMDAALAAVLVALINMLGSVLLRLVDGYFKHKDKLVEATNGNAADIHIIKRTPELRNGGHGVPMPGPGNPADTGPTPAS